MKKKTSMALSCFLVIMSLTACGKTDDEEITFLRKELFGQQQRIQALEYRVSQLEERETMEKSEESVTVETSSTVIEVENNTESQETTSKNDEEESTTISSETEVFNPDEKVKSENPEDWLEVAKCNTATETQLVEVAKKTAVLYYYNTNSADQAKQLEIAVALSNNPATTNNVMLELAKAEYPEVWRIVVLSNKSKEEALLVAAKNCSELNYYNSDEADEATELEIARAIAENPATTKAVMLQLEESRFERVVKIAKEWIRNNS